MEIMRNPDLVAAILTAVIIGRLDYGKDVNDSEKLAKSAKEAFKDIYRFVCGFNAEISENLKKFTRNGA